MDASVAELRGSWYTWTSKVWVHCVAAARRSVVCYLNVLELVRDAVTDAPETRTEAYRKLWLKHGNRRINGN